MKVTDEEIGLIRSRPQRTKLNLSIFTPTAIMKCKVNNASAARNDYVIPYDTVTTGSYTGVEAGMTMLVGSTDGAEDLGRIRIRSVDASEFTVAENSYIEWADDVFITVLRYWEVWPIYPRIISDPANAENTIWYKDYDIPYSNQNTILGSLPCAGPHRAMFLDSATGTASIYYTASGTHHVLDNAFSTHWWFEGGTPTGSDVYSPGLVKYGDPGDYVTRLIVSGSNGSVDTTYRYVSIYDRPEHGVNVPVLKWEITRINGSRSGGGYTATVRVLENISVHDGDVVVLFGESWFGNTKQTIGGNATGNSNIFFVGHILRGTIEYNYKVGQVSFEIGSITQYMKGQEGFSVSVESVSSPSYWYQLYDMDIESAIYHYWKWHSTVLSLSDVQFIGDDRPIQYFDSDRTSLYDAVDNLVRGALLGGITSDIQGKIWAEMGAQAFPLANNTYATPIMELQKGDWIDSPRIEEQMMPKTSYLEYGGIAFSGVVTGTFSPLMSNAPGTAPLYRGKADRKQGLALKSQVELNSITGHVLANTNYRYPNIDYQLIASMRNLDIAPQQKVSLLVDADDTPRGVLISGSYMPDSIDWAYDSKSQLFYPDRVSFSPLVTGVAGQTIVIPAAPEEEGSGYSQPSIKLPAVPSVYTPTIISTSSLSYIHFDLDTSDLLGTSGQVVYGDTIKAKNSPVTIYNSGYAYIVFNQPGLYSVSITLGLYNYDDFAIDDNFQAMFLSSSYNQCHLFANFDVEGGDPTYAWLNMSGMFYVYAADADNTHPVYGWITYPKVGTAYILMKMFNINGSNNDVYVFNSDIFLTRLGS